MIVYLRLCRKLYKNISARAFYHAHTDTRLPRTTVYIFPSSSTSLPFTLQLIESTLIPWLLSSTSVKAWSEMLSCLICILPWSVYLDCSIQRGRERNSPTTRSGTSGNLRWRWWRMLAMGSSQRYVRPSVLNASQKLMLCKALLKHRALVKVLRSVITEC